MKKIMNVEVVSYNPDWPELFKKEAEKIKQALGNNCIEVHHIGSTSVPGLNSKPKIDIIAEVKVGDVAIVPLERIGYIYKGEWNIPFKYGFSKRSDVQVNLHVYEEGNPEIELNLKIRDYLRENLDARIEYQKLKYDLLSQESSFEKNNSMFTGYNLGKDKFIRNILEQVGFNSLRMLRCIHHVELESAKNLRQKYIFDPNNLKDPYLWTFNSKSHVHFIYCKGTKIIGYVHLQLWPENRAALRIIAIDENYRNNGYGGDFLKLCEKWLEKQSYKSIHIESSPKAYFFYKKYGYIEMPFNDPDNYPSDERDIQLGKVL